jgi:hypothetical protein
MKLRRKITGLACLFAATLGSFGQTVGLGLKFAATDPDAATSSLLPEEIAGVVPQANWNNLTGATGTDVGSLEYDNGGTATPSAATVTWTSPNTWRSGANNAFPDGPDRKLVSGYLDTGNTAANGINITVNNIDPVFASAGYDVYVYFVSDSTANRGGAYTLNDGNTNVVKYGSTMAAPSAFVEDPGTDQNLSLDGNYLRFRQLTGTSVTLKTDTTLTTPNGTRAPINAIQIVPSPQFGPDVVTQPVSVSLYAGRTAKFSAVVDGYPAITSLKWQKDGVDVTDGGRISGATTANLVITGVTAADQGDYTLVATSSRGTITSNPANLAIATQDASAYPTAVVNAGPVANWRLNEPETVTTAFDHVGGFTGEYRDAAVWGSTVEGPRPPTFPGFNSDNTAVQIGGAAAPGHVAVPTPALNTNTVSIVAWINPAAAQADYTGILMTRAGTLAGFGYTTGNQLGYTWNNNNAATWGWNSGLRPTDNEWSLAVLVVNSNRATIYLGSGGTISAAINPIAHTAEAWGSLARIGDDTGGAGRNFNGRLDEVAVFNRALSFDEVAALYAAGTGAAQNPKPIISPQPQSATRFAGATVQFKSGATGTGTVTYQWQKGGANVANDARISGATTDSLTIRNLTAADAGDYTLVATNPNGSTTSTVATLAILPSPAPYVTEVIADAPLSYWRLNETDDVSAGTAIAHDYVGGRDGTYGNSAIVGIEGPRPAQSFGGFEADNTALQSTASIANSWVTTPPLGIATNQMTFLAWIYPQTRVANAGIIFARAGQAATGLGLAGTGNLGYTWLDQAATYNFASGLTPPLNQWSLVAVAVEPTRAVLYMINADGVRSATNTVAHNVRNFSDNIRIGGDPNSNNRTFDGRIDEATIFDRALTQDELNRLFQRALGSVPPSIAANPVPVERFVGDTISLTVSAVGTQPLTYRWEKRVGDTFQTVNNGGNISGASTATLTITGATAADAGEYRAVVTNSLGTATSEPAAIALLLEPPAPAAGTFGSAVLANDAYSYWRFNEMGDPSSGTLLAFDSAGRRHGTYGVASGNGSTGVNGPRPADGFTKFEETNTALGTAVNVADSWATMPVLGLETNAMTIVAWINPTTLVNNAGIVFWRAGQPATGLNLNGTGNLGYHWLDAAATYNWNSGLTPTVGQWQLAAVSVEPTRAVAYLIDANGLRSATNDVTHAVRTFSDTLRIGGDPLGPDRNFDGAIDEVAIFDRALTPQEIQNLYNGVSTPGQLGPLTIAQNNGQITINWSGPGQLQSTTAFNGAATAWTNETTTGNTYTTTASGQMKFYRLVQ